MKIRRRQIHKKGILNSDERIFEKMRIFKALLFGVKLVCC